MGRSRSSSRSRSRSRSSSGRQSSAGRRRQGGRRRSNSGEEEDGTRLHVSDIPVSCNKADLEKTFEKFGPLLEVWKTNSVPCFAFVVFRNKEDAEDAMRSLNGQHVFGSRIRVTLALPRARERQRRSGGAFNSDARCYQCGMPGHFSRSCRYYEGAGRNRMVPSPTQRRRFSPPRRQRRRSGSSSGSRSGSRSRRPQNSRDRRDSGDRYRSSERKHREDRSRRSYRSRSPDGRRSRSHGGADYEDEIINAQDL